jgi:hypothetical protein
VPRLTPSRLPLFDQRWTVLPSDMASFRVVDGGALIPEGSEQALRWNHTGDRIEGSVSYFNGFNHLPNLAAQVTPSTLGLTRVYAPLRTIGADVALPTRWFTLKGETAYFTSPSSSNEEYLIYVAEIERQVGEWVLDGGYAGEVVTTPHGSISFAPDRGIARSFIGRVSYTIGPRRSVAVEGAVRQSGEGVYLKGEYTVAVSQHWRTTFTGVALAGETADFLGQYERNSHGSIAFRYSF